MTHNKCLTNEFFNKELFTVSEQEIEEFKQKFELQCPILYERFKDNFYYMNLLKMMTIEQKNIYMNDYLLHVASEWRRDRIEYGDELRSICFWLPGKRHISNIPVIDHWNKLKEIEISPDNYSEFRSADSLVHVSLREICEYHALYDPLIVPPSFRINDCLETTMKYICAAAEWIDDMIKKSKTSIFPFQIELCIHYAATIDSNDDCARVQFPIIDHAKKATLQQFDDALKRYYNSMGVEYVNQFSNYAEEYGYEPDYVVEEITNGKIGCMILDFDENIPLKQEFKNINDRENEIFNLLFKICNHPYYDFKRPYNINQISTDRIGDIQKKLERKKSKYACIECDSNGIFYNNEFIVCSWIRININLNQNVLYTKDIIFLLAKYVDDAEWSLQTQSFVKLFNKFTGKNKEKNNVKNKRFITFIDRRNSARNIDTLWMFEPFQCANIPNDAISYWYFNALKTFLLPNNINVDNANQCDDNKDTNPLLLTFSFHVKAADSIKCFLYYKNGEMMQFMPKHIKNVLPKLFTTNLNATFDGSVNVQFMENENVISQQIKRINKILHDNPFDFRGIEK